jgi:hypothetical protein
MTLPHQPKQPLIACSRLVKATSPPRPPLSIRRHLLMLPPGKTLDEPERYTPTDNVFLRSFTTLVGCLTLARPGIGSAPWGAWSST